ncbi:hypothetical protein K1719_028381 [Acacia pycnantha]|nr:hypothetical protein K1719_028381 [Acacia pycnantha]
MSLAGDLVFSVFLFLVGSSLSDEFQMLMKFKSSVQTSNADDVFGSWTEANSPCNFTGILCNSNGFVSEINLAGRNLGGTIRFDSLCGLQSLEKLSLGSNSFHGRISEDLRKCSNLNGISGTFPWKSLGNLTSLGFLSLGDNLFEKSPFPVEVLKLEKLYWLYLTNCSITGKIPLGIGNLTQLEELELSDNLLTGEIPGDIGKLQKLRQLEIYDNYLIGKIPKGLGNLTNLVYLDVSNNQLEGDISELRFLKNLASLQLFQNQFSGGIPNEFGDFKSLTEFSLYANNFTGPLPQKLGSWDGLQYIDVSDNSLSGPIPPDMCRNNNMTELAMLNNSFTGSIPETYANCSAMVRFLVNRNSLSGRVASGLWGLPNMEIIDLSMNQFEGISEASSLVSIKLSSNQFSGKLPDSIGNLKKLGSLKLDGNNFSGSIPESLSSCISLSEVNIAGNSLSGEIPTSLGSLPTLNSLNLSSNSLSGEIPPSLSSLKLSLLDLSNNNLFGPVPDSLSIPAFIDGLKGNPSLCSENLENFRPCSLVSTGSSRVRTIILCLLAGIMVLLVSLACIFFLKLKQNKLEEKPLKTNSWDLKQYHVVLKCGKELAVKHIWTSNPGEPGSGRSSSVMLKRSCRSPEYDAEVATLSSIRHVNVVKLYCSITSEDSSLLVYEFLPNGSLWDKLHNCQKSSMSWEVRYEIALGAARGLEYLHHGCDRPVIHRDVKSSNILIDKEWKPRIADFGLAKIVQRGAGNWTNVIAGTLGYMAPEYAYTCKDIVNWVCGNKRTTKGDMVELVDSTIPKHYKHDAMKVLRIATLCTVKVPYSRPSMRMVVQMLEEAVPCSLTDVVVAKDG